MTEPDNILSPQSLKDILDNGAPDDVDIEKILIEEITRLRTELSNVLLLVAICTDPYVDLNSPAIKEYRDELLKLVQEVPMEEILVGEPGEFESELKQIVPYITDVWPDFDGPDSLTELMEDVSDDD